MANPFISPQDLLDYTGRSSNLGTADPGLLIATDSACDVVRDITELTINQVVGDVWTTDGTGTDAIVVPEVPLNGAGTVVVNGGTISDYLVDFERGMLFRGTGLADPNFTGWWGSGSGLAPTWPKGRRNIQVTYDHGWADQEIPRSIRLVALALASRVILQGPAIQESIADVSIRYGVNATDLTANELRILQKHRPR